MTAKYIKPVYNGDELLIGATDESTESELRLEVRKADETVVAVSRVSLPAVPESILGPVAIERSTGPKAPVSVPADHVGIGYQLGDVEASVDRDEVERYLDGVASRSRSLYLEAAAVPPSLLAWVATKYQIAQLESRNANVGVACAHQMFRAVRIGEPLLLSGCVSNVYEKGGHEMWDVDVLFRSADGEPVAEVRKTTIYRLARKEDAQ